MLWDMQVLLVFVHTVVSYWVLSKGTDELVHPVEKTYLWGFVALEAYCSVVHPYTLGVKLAFLPLLLTSVYSAVGVTYVWLCMAYQWLQQESVGSTVHAKAL